MNHRGYIVLCLLLAAALSVPASANLLDYVAQPDPAYQWLKVGEQAIGTTTVIDLALVSQVWQGITWSHTIRIFAPAQVSYPDAALLYITGGNPSVGDVGLGVAACSAIGAPLAILYNIPNQPLFGGLSEDALIAYTFVRYLETGDPTWPLLLPMVKSAVRAMDALQEFAPQQWGRSLDTFVVTGASKRGWTTWLTGAVDQTRVKGIAPMVIDILNFPAQFTHQLETWGEYSEMIDDYTNLGLEAVLGDADSALRQMVDPYCYRERITMPKLIINGTNDPYWVIDALNLYWGDLVGAKSVLYVPNSGHGLEDFSRVLNTLSGFFHHIAGGSAWPTMSWKHDDDRGVLTLRIKAHPAPTAARIWAARSQDLDFRDETWQSTPMIPDRKQNTFVGAIPAAQNENVALFGEAEFSIGGRRFTLSTQVRVVAAPNLTPPGRSAFGRLRAGAAKAAITPDPSNPQYLAGYDENRMMWGVHDDVWARALYLTDGRSQLVLASLDLIGLTKPDMDDIIAAVAPVVGPNVIITNTHTHSGPDVIGLWGPDPFTPGWDEAYLEYVKQRTVQAILEARQASRPARLWFGSALTTPEDRIAWNANERWFQPDSPPWAPGRGRGPQDYEVSVMRVEARHRANPRQSDTIATVFNFACHPEVAGDSDDPLVRNYLSSDIGHYAYEEIESAAGGVAIWLQGALGAMVTADNQSETWEEAERIGRALGRRALEGAQNAELETNPYIACASRTLNVPLYNDIFYWGLMWGVLRSGPDRVAANGDSPFGVGVSTTVTVAQIGGLQIAATPGETYPKIGLNIKQNILTAPHKMVLGLSQDELGYIMYPFDYGTAEYGYETTMSVGPTIGTQIEEALAEALAELNG